MKVVYAKSDTEGERWEEFVYSSPAATCYHRWNWKQVIERSFGWPTYYLVAEDEEGRVAGLLPLVWQKSVLFGSFLTSLPFLNAGGILSASKQAERALLEEAVALIQPMISPDERAKPRFTASNQP